MVENFQLSMYSYQLGTYDSDRLIQILSALTGVLTESSYTTISIS